MCGECLPSSRATVTAAESCLSIRHTPFSERIEIHDSNMQLWKIIGGGAAHVVDIPQIGRVVTSSVVSADWDVQNDHAGYFSSIDKDGHDASFN
jgi:hypothetical protein